MKIFGNILVLFAVILGHVALVFSFFEMGREEIFFFIDLGSDEAIAIKFLGLIIASLLLGVNLILTIVAFFKKVGKAVLILSLIILLIGLFCSSFVFSVPALLAVIGSIFLVLGEK